MAREVAKDLNLSALLEARVGTPEKRGVSGGQRKRVSIAWRSESQAMPFLHFYHVILCHVMLDVMLYIMLLYGM